MSRPPTQTRRAHEQDLDGFRTAVKRARCNTKRAKVLNDEIIERLDGLILRYTEEQHGEAARPPKPQEVVAVTRSSKESQGVSGRSTKESNGKSKARQVA